MAIRAPDGANKRLLKRWKSTETWIFLLFSDLDLLANLSISAAGNEIEGKSSEEAHMIFASFGTPLHYLGL